MKSPTEEAPKARRKFLLAIAWVLALIALMIIGELIMPARAQAPTPQSAGVPQQKIGTSQKIAFEVASVKPAHSENVRSQFHFTPDRFTATNLTTKDFIQFAYYAQDYQLSKGPEWINSARYDIDARVPDPIALELRKQTQLQQMDPIRFMLQSLLADRFKLKVSYASKEMPIYVLVVAKNGPKLTQSTITPANSGDSNLQGATPEGPHMGITGRGEITGNDVPLKLLADILSHQLGRQVLDKTGLTGNYDVRLKWSPDETQPPSGPDNNPTSTARAAPPPDSSRPSIFTALQEQLGLKLESQKGPVDVLVIEHIEEPSPN
jgi:uncharacterized protein (TIGR03435 family)